MGRVRLWHLRRSYEQGYVEYAGSFRPPTREIRGLGQGLGQGPLDSYVGFQMSTFLYSFHKNNYETPATKLGAKRMQATSI